MAFCATYDACVLHPAVLRDLLVRLAGTGLFRATWSDDILGEMVASVLKRRPDLTPTQLERTRELMHEALPGSLVEGYRDLIEGLELPDLDDRGPSHRGAGGRAAGAAAVCLRCLGPTGTIRVAEISSGASSTVTIGNFSIGTALVRWRAVRPGKHGGRRADSGGAGGLAQRGREAREDLVCDETGVAAAQQPRTGNLRTPLDGPWLRPRLECGCQCCPHTLRVVASGSAGSELGIGRRLDRSGASGVQHPGAKR